MDREFCRQSWVGGLQPRERRLVGLKTTVSIGVLRRQTRVAAEMVLTLSQVVRWGIGQVREQLDWSEQTGE